MKLFAKNWHDKITSNNSYSCLKKTYEKSHILMKSLNLIHYQCKISYTIVKYKYIMSSKKENLT